jgi:hypothetical protein
MTGPGGRATGSPSSAPGIVERLLGSPEPSVRLKALLGVVGVADDADEAHRARQEVRGSARVRALLAERAPDGTIPGHAYHTKWYGPHWVLVTLAELGYPAGDGSLRPLREQVLGWLLSREYTDRMIGTVRGRTAIHASIDGNAVWALRTLGLADERVEDLVARLLDTQWPDGGWNCDRSAGGGTSAFAESLIPLRALAQHARLTGSARSARAAELAAEVFLARRLFRRRRDAAVIHPSFVRLHYPCYWHYDVLFGLKVLAEAGFVRDPRCGEALDLLEAKRLADGGFPAEARHYRLADAPGPGPRSLVDWDGTGRRRMNQWVTVEALAVLRAAGRSVGLVETSS